MKINLFCIPYAGGTASVFNEFSPYLNPNVQLRNIELAGKGIRLKEPVYDDLSEAVADVFQILEKEIADTPYMLFGHSMGAKIIYKLLEKIQQKNLKNPLHIFLSGSSAPHFRREDRELYHMMDNDAFKEKIIELGGTPPNFFEYPELVEIFLPALKNDFMIMETADYGANIKLFPCDLSVLIGKEDDLTLEEREGWKNYTDQACAIHYFEGGHFFFLDKIKQVAHIINQAIASKQKLGAVSRSSLS